MSALAAMLLIWILIIFCIWRDVATWLFPVDYERYIHSERWRRKAREARRRAGQRCGDCGARSRRLDVHHKTYARLGYEWWFDLIALCRRCHRRRHGLL